MQRLYADNNKETDNQPYKQIQYTKIHKSHLFCLFYIKTDPFFFCEKEMSIR